MPAPRRDFRRLHAGRPTADDKNPLCRGDGHIERLEQLRDSGRLILAGPYPAIDSTDPGPAGFTGSLIVAEFENLEEADLWAAADPYVAAGVYANVMVKPFKRVLP